jgi:hypothetical protein
MSPEARLGKTSGLERLPPPWGGVGGKMALPGSRSRSLRGGAVPMNLEIAVVVDLVEPNAN